MTEAAEHARHVRAALRLPRIGRGAEAWTTAVVFLVPTLTLFTLFVALPVAEAGWYSLFRWNGYGPPTDYVGLANFERLMGHPPFRTALWNTGLIIAASLVLQLPLALWLALILADRMRGAVALRALFFLPYILAEVATALIWRFVYDARSGLAAAGAEAAGVEPVFVLAEPGLAIWAIVVVVTWKFFGFHMMIYIAGLQNVPREVVESATVDGASWWQTAWRIKVPMIAPVIRLSVFFAILGGLQVFDLVWAMTGGGPAHASHTVVTYLFEFGIERMRIGFGSAVGVVLFVVCVVFAFGYRRLLMRED